MLLHVPVCCGDLRVRLPVDCDGCVMEGPVSIALCIIQAVLTLDLSKEVDKMEEPFVYQVGFILLHTWPHRMWNTAGECTLTRHADTQHKVGSEGEYTEDQMAEESSRWVEGTDLKKW